jgi:hypothetical protein
MVCAPGGFKVTKTDRAGRSFAANRIELAVHAAVLLSGFVEIRSGQHRVAFIEQL